MKKLFLTYFFIASICFTINAQITSSVPTGSGDSEIDPYLISSLAELYWIKEQVNTGANNFVSKYFKQTNDINASETATWFEGLGWEPIGNISSSTVFQGSYNGDGHIISGLVINRSGNEYVGFFSDAHGYIKNLGLTELSVVGGNYVGGLAGANTSYIENCFTTGTITGWHGVGGLVGDNEWHLDRCYSSCTVSGAEVVGGLAGINWNPINDCYATGDVYASDINEETGVGGLVGFNDWAYISRCYAIGNVSYSYGDTYFGGLVGNSSGGVDFQINCFWNISINPTADNGFGTPKSTAEMKILSTFTTATWDFKGETTNGNDEIWNIGNGRNEGYPYLSWQYPDDNGINPTWTGTSSIDWNTATNWNTGLVPSSSENCSIGTASYQPTISSAVTCANLTIESGAKVIVSPSGLLTVSETLTNNADSTGLVLASDASGTGQLINSTSGVRASVQQFIAEDKWHYLGIPFANSAKAIQHFKGLYVAECIEDSAIHNSSMGWVYLDTTNNIVPGTGYGLYHDLDTTITIFGTLNATEQTVPVTWRDAEHGWNLISNPFPCAVDWDYVRNNSGLSGVNDAIYVYDAGSDSYASYIDGVTGGAETQNQYIAPNQGFFVRSTAAGSVVISESAKSTGAATFKSSNLDPLIRLTVTSPNGRTDNTVIRTAPQSTENFDGQYDAYKLLSTGSATPQLYSSLKEEEYSVNSIPKINHETVIPIKVLAKQDGTHTIALTELSSYSYSYPIMIYNPANNELVNIENKDYNFSATAGETVSFQLLFGNGPTGIEMAGLDNIAIKLIGHQLQVSGLGTGKSAIWVYNTNGQVLCKGTTVTDNYSQDNLPTGVLIVRVQKDSGIRILKTVVK